MVPAGLRPITHRDGALSLMPPGARVTASTALLEEEVVHGDGDGREAGVPTRCSRGL
jgi:hypothetical protein